MSCDYHVMWGGGGRGAHLEIGGKFCSVKDERESDAVSLSRVSRCVPVGEPRELVHTLSVLLIGGVWCKIISTNHQIPVYSVCVCVCVCVSTIIYVLHFRVLVYIWATEHKCQW